MRLLPLPLHCVLPRLSLRLARRAAGTASPASTRLCTEPSAKRVTSSSPAGHVAGAAHERPVGPQGQAVAPFELALHVVGVEQAAHGAHALLGTVEMPARRGRQPRRPRPHRRFASVERGRRPPGQRRRFVAQALAVRAQLVPRRRGQAAARRRVARLGVGQERRHAPGQRVGRRRHVRAPPLTGRHRDGVPALGRRDAGTGRDDVGHGLVSRVPDAGEDRLGRRRHGAGHDLGLERGEVRPRTAAAHRAR